MNKLNIERQTQIIKVLCEGNSIRSTARITNSAVNTVIKLLKQTGMACLEYQDKVMRNLPCKNLQCDEIWSYVYSKDKNVPDEHKGEFGYGDVWTFTAIDADTKLVPCWMVGNRDYESAHAFILDLKGRLANRIQLTTDGHKMYVEAIENAFGSEIDFAQLVKLYGQDFDEKEKRYSPSQCIGADRRVVQGYPNKSQISTSYVERQNLTMRMSMRRFTRLTNGFSKKVENHILALALYFMYYNFARPHKSLSKPYPKTPAMATGLTRHIWTVEEIVELTNN